MPRRPVFGRSIAMQNLPIVRSVKRNTRNLSAFATVLSAVLLFCASAPAAQETDVGSEHSQSATYSVTVDDGLLFIDGKGVAAPYHIEATEDVVSVNGMTCISEGGNALIFDDEDERSSRMPRADQGRGPAWRAAGREGRRRGPGIGEGSSDRRGSWFADRGRDRRFRPGSPVAGRQAQTLAGMLESGNIVVAFDGAVQPIGLASDERIFCETLLSEDVDEKNKEQFLALCYSTEGRKNWSRMLQEFEKTDPLAPAMQERIDRLYAAEAENNSQVAAVYRLDTLSYPLTVLGMLLGAFAFGHMLQWSGKGITSSQDQNRSSEVGRHVVVAVFLMFCMSTLDLVWTILAGQAGVMREVNPLAAGFVRSPEQLAVFKVAATVTGLGILYVWRQRQQIQLATWWMCLVCVLLTFRWVVFDSLAT